MKWLWPPDHEQRFTHKGTKFYYDILTENGNSPSCVVYGKSSKARKMACYVHLEKRLNKENATEAYNHKLKET